jgi:hypothetical protein
LARIQIVTRTRRERPVAATDSNTVLHNLYVTPTVVALAAGRCGSVPAALRRDERLKGAKVLSWLG